MGTNYYAHRIPTKEEKDALKDAIDKNDYDTVFGMNKKLYGRLESYISDNIEYHYGKVHLGKASVGWKFLWNPNVYKRVIGHIEREDVSDGIQNVHYVVDDEYHADYPVYELTKESIKAFIDRDDIEIYDEYGQKIDKDEFWELALKHGAENGFDSDTYDLRHDGHNQRGYYDTDYSRFLEKNGYKLSKSKTDFYSDGLRFSVGTDFC